MISDAGDTIIAEWGKSEVKESQKTTKKSTATTTLVDV